METLEILMVLVMVLPTFADVNYEDITIRGEFGCRWYGGSTARVTCNCSPGSEMVINKNIPTLTTTEIEIFNCKAVTFEADSIADMRSLRSVRLDNIQSVTVQEEGLNWFGYRDIGNDYEERFDVSIPAIRINVHNSNVTLISSHAFKGRINEIVFENVTIERILAVAFANLLQTERMAFKNTVLGNIALQSFKGFIVKNLDLDGVVADIVPSRTFSNVTVLERLVINNCTFGTVHSGAFAISNPQAVQITLNKVNHLNGEAFKVTTRGIVQVLNNTFNKVDDGAFSGITTNSNDFTNNGALYFESNTLSSISRNSLSTGGIDARFSHVYLNVPCDCDEIDKKIQDSAYYKDMKCLYNANYMVVEDYKSNMCSIISNHYVTLIVASATVVVLVVIVTGLALYYKSVYKSRRYGSKKQLNGNGALSLIVPDGRTYRETELHVIVEKNDLLTTDL